MMGRRRRRETSIVRDEGEFFFPPNSISRSRQETVDLVSAIHSGSVCRGGALCRIRSAYLGRDL